MARAAAEAAAAAIVGIGATRFSKASGRTELELATEAIRSAVDDAGLELADVDGLVTFTVDSSDEIDVASSLALQALRFFGRVPYGGGGACGIVHLAATAIRSRAASVVVCYRGLNGRSGQRYGGGGFARAVPSSTDARRSTWYSPFGAFTPATWLAPVAQRYLYEYGATSADFGRVAVALREHAATNPAARFYERPLTLEEHQASRWIVEPLRLLDCCMESDGGVALVVCGTDRSRGLRHPPAVVAASAQSLVGAGRETMTSYYGNDITVFPELDLMMGALRRSSGLTVRDVQTAVMYDHFTPFVLMQLEGLGFCKPGEAPAFVADGHIGLGGSLPVNTHGGHIGEAYIHGLNGVAEAVRQVRGTAVNQCPDVEHVLVTAGTGMPTSALIVGQW